MPQLTPTRRSQLLQMLLEQQATPHRGQRSGFEMITNLASKFLQKKHIDKLREQEMADEQNLIDALTQQQMQGTPGSGPVTQTQGEAIMGDEGDPFTVTKKERGTKPGVGIREDALARVLALPSGQRGRGLAALQAISSMQDKSRPDNPSFGGGFAEATEDILGRDGKPIVNQGEEFRYWTTQDPNTREVRHGITTRNGPVEVFGDQFRDVTTRQTDPGATRAKISQWAEDLALLGEDMRKTEILMQMDPEEFVSYFGRGKKGLLDFMNKLGLTADEQDNWLKDAQTFKGLTAQIFQGIRREVTGAQAAKIELDVLEEAFLSPKMGPSQYAAALTLIGQMQQSIYDTKKSLIADGITPDSNPDLFSRSIDRAIDQYIKAGSQFRDSIDEDSTKPDDIPQEEWDVMTPEEKALF